MKKDIVIIGSGAIGRGYLPLVLDNNKYNYKMKGFPHPCKARRTTMIIETLISLAVCHIFKI